jgi:hypothetical protein
MISCGGSKDLVEAEEDFDKFYDRFHEDMDFQMERIQFPLEGGSAEVDGTYPWNRENWITMKVKIYDVDKTVYIVDYQKSDDVFSQSFKLKGSGFSAEYRFKKINKKWYLVYALDTNL